MTLVRRAYEVYGYDLPLYIAGNQLRAQFFGKLLSCAEQLMERASGAMEEAVVVISFEDKCPARAIKVGRSFIS